MSGLKMFNSITKRFLSGVRANLYHTTAPTAMSKGQDQYISTSDSMVVYVTVPNQNEASGLAKSIIESKLAACVNIVPSLTSVYRWDDKVCEDSELLLIIKTTSSRVEALHSHVRANHSYDTPEFITLPVTGGSAAYLHWMKQQ